MNQYFDSHSKTGTAAGTLLTIIANLDSRDIVKTILLAGIGAVVSFGVTQLLKVIIRRIRKM
ncbi:MAG: hypothetical protein JST39_09090 [Bacteroidetes bacterium]|nr:hypothetical protein [Bacteroidota bacterium]